MKTLGIALLIFGTIVIFFNALGESHENLIGALLGGIILIAIGGYCAFTKEK